MNAISGVLGGCCKTWIWCVSKVCSAITPHNDVLYIPMQQFQHKIQHDFTVPPGKPGMVFIAHLEYCVQNGLHWSALHTYYIMVCVVDIEVLTVRYSPECALDTAMNTQVFTPIQCAMHLKLMGHSMSNQRKKNPYNNPQWISVFCNVWLQS